MIWNAQVVNSILAIVFFYTIPFFGIAPKTILFIDLIISFVLSVGWRTYGSGLFGLGTRSPALLIGSGNEMKELFDEVNGNSRYGINFVSSLDVSDISGVDIQGEVITPIYENGVKIIAVDFSHRGIGPLLPHLYNLIFSGVGFIDSHRIYEDIFDRIPLSLVTYSWFLENISVSPKFAYDFLKRVMDIVISLPLWLLSLIMYPFVWLAIKLEDGGEIFSHQKRVGQNNRTIELLKFRTMFFNDGGDWQEKGKVNRVTRVGAFLRKTRLDEFPQLWNVLSGDISLIGPRPEFPEPVEAYDQTNKFLQCSASDKTGTVRLGPDLRRKEKLPKFTAPTTIRTKIKLSYDLFYIKNRSFWLDIKIALKTIRELVSRRGV